MQENFAAGNITLTEEEVESIKAAVEDVGVKGGRYFDLSKEQEHRWG